MEYQKFKLEDNEIKLVENKDLYNSILNLNKQYYFYYRNMSKIDRNFKGDIINYKISKMLDLSSKIYFDKNKNYLDKIYLILKEIEFQTRVLHKLNILSNKSKIVLQKIFNDISKQVKCLINNELCK